jgi:uncharacterized membrane protein
MWGFIRRCLVGGLLVWLPLLATLFVLRFIITLIDSSLLLLPSAYQPQHLFGMNIPGLGVVISILILFLTGLLAGNFLGRKMVELGEFVLARIPVVRTIYSAVKQVLETVFSPSSQSFRQVLLVRFPHQESWTLGFSVGQVLPEVNKVLEKELMTVFIPTTPNPTSGYIVMVPKEDVKILNMSVDEALKFVISLGVVQPKKIGA